MTIVRAHHNKENPYLTMDKTALEDTRLSWKAKGILAYLLSKPDNWTVYCSELEKRAEDGERSVRSGLKELERYGYLERRRIRGNDEKGRQVFTGWETIVYERPIKLVKSKSEVSNSERQNVDLEKVEPENVALINNERLSNDQTINEFKEKKAAKLTKRKDKELFQRWFNLARAKGIVAGQKNTGALITGLNYSGGPSCTRPVLEVMAEYPIDKLQYLKNVDSSTA